MSRNTKGLIGWSLVTLLLMIGFVFIVSGIQTVLFPMIIALSAMTIREIYQYKKYLKPCNKGFEWDDIALYTFDIMFTSIVMGMIFVLLNIIE